MRLDTICLILAILGSILYGSYVIFIFSVAFLATSTHWLLIPFFSVILIGLWVLYIVYRDRLSNAEDDYYEKNVEK